MPLHHQPFTLKRLSLIALADNFEFIFYNCTSASEMKSLVDSGAYLETKSQMFELPTSLIVDLAEELKHKTYLRCHHIHVLISPTLHTWNSDGIADQTMAFHLIKTRCKNLKKLNMAYVRQLNYEILLNLLTSFSNLLVLDLRMTLTVDEIMSPIAECCEHLIDLNLSGTPITDRGVIQLCVDVNGKRRCQKLARLSISDTWVTASGAAVVLRSLENLRDFDFENIFEALEQVELWDKSSLLKAGIRMVGVPDIILTQLKLTSLTSTTEYSREDGLDIAVRLCPEASAVSIANSWLPNEALYKLMLLNHLSSLSLTNCEGCTFDFYEGVLPLLSVCGSRLQSLILTNFYEVDLSNVGKACPGIKNIAFSKVCVFKLPTQLNPEFFNQVEAMELWSDSNIEMNPLLMKQLLLFSPLMRNILFDGCSILSDKLLYEIWEQTIMKTLQGRYSSKDLPRSSAEITCQPKYYGKHTKTAKNSNQEIDWSGRGQTASRCRCCWKVFLLHLATEPKNQNNLHGV